MARIHPDLRRIQWLDRLDNAAFWICVGVVIGVVWLVLANGSSV